jgi:hypothetical protein
MALLLSFMSFISISDGKKTTLRHLDFCAPFNEIEADTIVVGSPHELLSGSEKPENVLEIWKPLLNNNYFSLITTEIRDKKPVLYTQGMFSINDSIKALFFARNNFSLTAAVTDMCFFNLRSRKMTGFITLSDIWGDEGSCTYKKTSWIIDLNNDGMQDIVSLSSEFKPGDIGGVEKYTNMLIDSLLIYKNYGNHFELASFHTHITTIEKNIDNPNWSGMQKSTDESKTLINNFPKPSISTFVNLSER